MYRVQEHGTSIASSTASSPRPFLSKTYDMVDDPLTNAVVSWGKSGNSFVVWNVPEFARDFLPKCFKHNNFSSFVRQLNTYGFKKVDSDRWEFPNEGFLKGQKHLLKSISRRKPIHGQSHQRVSQVQSTPIGSCVEVGKFGIEQDVEQLKQYKNTLMQELVQVRQQQQMTDNQLHTVGNRMDTMEQRQQHMMSFLAKAMQSPGFITKLVQQQNDSSRRISGVNKKRRLPKKEDENFVGKCSRPISSDAQIINDQPLMNEAAKAMMRLILKINASTRLEQINNSNGFVIGNVPSPSDVLDSSSSTNQLTLSEVLSTSSHSCVESQFPSTTISETKYHSSVAPPPEMNMLNFQGDNRLPDSSEIQGFMEKPTVGVPELPFKDSKTQDTRFVDRNVDTNMDSLSEFVDGGINAIPDGFSSDPGVDVLLDGIPKLPGINDVFWEQFLSASSPTVDSDEINTEVNEGGVGKDSGWEKNYHLHHLNKQIGLLASGSTPV